MTQSIRHRGPDDEGFFVDAASGAGQHGAASLFLGHRRLAIFDRSGGAAQPMTEASGRYTLAWNGAIYNYPELLAELGSEAPRGCRSDTVALLHLWARYGPEVLARLNGMFALALWDARERTLYLARDRFGKKPLFYALGDDGELIFGSEIKALLTTAAVSRRVDLEALCEFLATRDIDHHPDRTLLSGVRQVPPGSLLRVRARRGLGAGLETTESRYYHLSPPELPLRPLSPLLVDETRALLTDALRLRLRGDVTVGGSLSGGLDSSVLTALAVQAQPTDYRVFISEFPGQAAAGDETAWADQVVTALQLPTDRVTRSAPSSADFLADLEAVLWHQEEPFADTSVVAHYALMRQVSRTGVRVLLTGQGGDEVMGGYGSYYYALLGSLLRRGRLWALGKEVVNRTRLQADAPLRLLMGAGYHALPQGLRQRAYAQRVAAEFPLSKEGQRLWQAAPARFALGLPAFCAGAPERWSAFDGYLLSAMARHALPHILRQDDRNSMAFGVESRAPYLDHRLLQLMLSTDPLARIGDGFTKRLLRQVAQGLLPEPVRLRVDKRGFFSPQVQWLLDAEELTREVLARPPTELAELADKKLLRQQVDAFYTQKNPQLAPVVWTALSVGLWLSRTLPRLGGVTTL